MSVNRKESAQERTERRERERPASAYRNLIKPWSDACDLLEFVLDEPTRNLQARYLTLSSEDRQALRAKAKFLREVLDHFESVLS